MIHATSLKMAPFGRSCTTFYLSAVVSIALLYRSEIFDVKEYHDLVIKMRGHSSSEFMYDAAQL